MAAGLIYDISILRIYCLAEYKEKNAQLLENTSTLAITNTYAKHLEPT